VKLTHRWAISRSSHNNAPVSEEKWLNELRVSYEVGGMDLADLLPTPLQQFQAWLADAVAAELPEPNAMVIATASLDAAPTTRTVLCKLIDERGFVFFTNTNSAKATQLANNPQIAATFLWLKLHRQVHIVGDVEAVSSAEADKYFATRARSSQIGAWASEQSSTLESRAQLEEKVAQLEVKFADQEQIPTPPFWGGYLIRPKHVEFWQGQRSRLHDRLRYELADESFYGRSVLDRVDAWQLKRLAP
jgi:pyridoxamine 5'-phosphate oxidase